MHKLLFLVLIQLIYTGVACGQSIKAQQGVVYNKGTGIRIGKADIFNKRSKFRVSSDGFGSFRILASIGDTLEVSCLGYSTEKFIVNDYKDAIIYIEPTNELEEVVVREKSIREDLREVEEAYRSKGVYYKGKPPVYLLIFKPLTFVHELFGKTAKNARRFNSYAKREIEYHEVARRFNNYTIKNAISIRDEELEDFKTDFWPTAEQINRWNDYDLMNYIKRSYEEFKRAKKGN
ncbi:hypothetical protein [Rubrolithibacter danxiaensis]|uniref:hypothetical protein n=1 Tax=Rubrolithibacter danxiaensis TaxID=3390805 RepID=UPI003BF791B0